MEVFRDLEFTGTVSMNRYIKPLPSTFKSEVILLLGLTGTGKSNFLEALSGSSELKISGNSLESVTQDLTLYELVNVHYRSTGRKIFFIDCPGFCDDKTSEFKLIKMIQEWLNSTSRTKSRDIFADSDDRKIDTILYFHRITDKRLPSTHKETLRLISSLVGDPYQNQTSLAVVTTMWDTLWRPTQLQEAEIRFAQLKENLKEFLGPIANEALRFHNTQNSAFHIIDDVDFMCTSSGTWAAVRRGMHRPPLLIFSDKKLRNAPFAEQLAQLIHDRIARLEQSIRILDDDILQLEQDENRDSDVGARNELLGMKTRAQGALHIAIREKADLLAILEPARRPSIRRRVLGYIHDKFKLSSGSGER
ncbi:hypothetical protein CVT24_004600 [Panaeolus cyanescens]|uniref:G domain-containing protein n=1 Tax=Panaeolus cyanescens TaxID=181874 RepID=A0A409YBD9_9AGAR|nr:hypothetical protein CVT24_004600 [Panaeolus cyanescens]